MSYSRSDDYVVILRRRRSKQRGHIPRYAAPTSSPVLVSQLFLIKGVTFVLVPDGVNNRVFEKGLNEWRKSHPVQVNEDAGGDHVRDNTEL